MRIEEGLDTGAILGRMTTPIDPMDSAQSVHDRLANMGWPLLEKHWEALANREPGTAQPDQGVLYAKN